MPTNESLESRVKAIEARLDSLGASGGGNPSLAPLLGYSPIINPQGFSSSMEMSMLEPPYCAEPISSSSGNASSVSDGFPELPPLHEALPVIETYFNDFNIALPLHHQPTFMKLLHRCYSGPENQKQRVEYALVHSVLAIGYRLRSGMDDIFIDGGFYPFAENESQLYFRNCERLLNDLVTRDEDTLGVQVLLALVVLHLANGDAKSAAMLISAAMRLAHSLQMHTRTSDDSFPLHEAQQRHNIFWICYIMDKVLTRLTSRLSGLILTHFIGYQPQNKHTVSTVGQRYRFGPPGCHIERTPGKHVRHHGGREWAAFVVSVPARPRPARLRRGPDLRQPLQRALAQGDARAA